MLQAIIDDRLTDLHEFMVQGYCGLLYRDKNGMIYAEYNMRHNSIDICTSAGYILIIDCEKVEAGLKTTPSSQHPLNVFALDNLLEYAKLYLDVTMQDWIDAEDSLEVW